MKRNKVSAVIGVLLVFVIGAAFLVFCKVSNANAPELTASNYDDDFYDYFDYDDYDDYDEEEMDPVASLEERGYVVSGQIPECVRKLIDTGLFAVTEEKIKQSEFDYFGGNDEAAIAEYMEEEYYDEDEDEDEEEELTPEEIAELIEEEKEELKDELKEGYKSALKRAEKYGEAKYLHKNNDLFVTTDFEHDYYDDEENRDLYCLLKWDLKAGECQDAEKIALIESCGFEGFSELISEVERRAKDAMAAGKKHAESYGGEDDEYDYDDYDDEYDDEDEDEKVDIGDAGYYWNEYFYLRCQGITFVLYDFSRTGYVALGLSKNNSTYYIPEKYKNIIDGMKADGSYFLHASYVAGGRDVLVFSRDNTVGLSIEDEINPYMYEGTRDEERRKYEDKRIVFIFENGKIVDYYMASQSGSMKLDDVDKKVLDAYVSGLGKTLSGIPETADEGTYLYRAN